MHSALFLAPLTTNLTSRNELTNFAADCVKATVLQIGVRRPPELKMASLTLSRGSHSPMVFLVNLSLLASAKPELTTKTHSLNSSPMLSVRNGYATNPLCYRCALCSSAKHCREVTEAIGTIPLLTLACCSTVVASWITAMTLAPTRWIR